MQQGILDTLLGYVSQGGHAMPPLIVGLAVLWYAIGYRLLTLHRGCRRSVRDLVDAHRSGCGHRPRGLVDRAARRGVVIARRYPEDVDRALDDAFFGYYQDAKRGRTLILGIAGIAPLIGLLGTVSGMIETFRSLGDMTLFAHSGGIAGGISQALFTTQMGLCVAIPGVIAGRLLDRQQGAVEDELDQLKVLIGSSVTGGTA